MSKELINPPGTQALQTNPEVGGAAEALKAAPSQLAYLKDNSVNPPRYLMMSNGYVITTKDVNQASKFLVISYGDGNWYIMTVDTAEYLSFTDRSYLYAYSAWSNARYVTLDPVSFKKYPGLYLHDGYVCCNGMKDKPDSLMNVHLELIR